LKYSKNQAKNKVLLIDGKYVIRNPVSTAPSAVRRVFRYVHCSWQQQRFCRLTAEGAVLTAKTIIIID